MTDNLHRTPLFDLHVSIGAKMTPFAGYEMPVQYPMGVMKEHLHTRAKAGLFDVSHMGQAWLTTTKAPKGGENAHQDIANAIETLAPGEIRKLRKGGLRYSVLLNDDGGVVDDLMITRPADDAEAGSLFLVVNAACKDNDFRLIQEKLGADVRLEIADDRALLAIQGPAAAGVVERLVPGSAQQKFMTMQRATWDGVPIYVSRCGYTGEDGFELSIPNADAERLARTLLADEDVEPIGLGARDSLRLEAGLCLYGHDLNETTSPVEGNIAFAIGKRRREEGGFPGAARIIRELSDGASRIRVGLLPEGRAPAREGAPITDENGAPIGVVTSGGFGPTLGGPLAMGYVAPSHAEIGARVNLTVRGKALPATVAAMPFTPQNYYRG